MKRFAAALLLLLCLVGCGPTGSAQPAGSPAFPELNPGDGGVLTNDLIAEGAIRTSFVRSEPDFSKPKQEGNEFVLRFCPDESVPTGTGLSGIEVWVYNMVMRPTSSDYAKEFDSTGVCRYFTDTQGEIHIFREDGMYISIHLQIDTFPEGVGVKQYGILFDPDEDSADYIISVPHSAEILVNRLDDIQVSLLDVCGEYTQAEYSYKTVYTRRALAPDQVEISGVVKCGELELPVLHVVDLSGEEEYYKLKDLERVGLVTRQEQKLLDSFGRSCTPTPGDWNRNGSNEEVLFLLLAVAAVVAVWLWIRRKK